MEVNQIHWTLGSASPRRLLILKNIGIVPTVITSAVNELSSHDFPEQLARLNAKLKFDDLESKVKNGILITADTVVEHQGSILGKPRDERNAADILLKLSGDWHKVHTGYCIKWIENDLFYQGQETTRVHFRSLTQSAIDHYIRSGEPMDKAGAYGIQERASQFVDNIEGCYFNVVGLPISLIVAIVERWQLDISQR